MTLLTIMLKFIKVTNIYLRVTEDKSTKLRKEQWSAIDEAVDCHSRKQLDFR